MTLERIQTSSKKVLILDCDNTLWGGVVGEDGYNGIRIGTDGEGLIFTDFQKSILRLKNEGVILCIVSKNNTADVMEVLNKNKNMVLKLEDFSLVKANWKTKSQNIKDLSVELDLSLESFVFFDDNSLERDLVRKNLHKVHVINPDIDISNWPQQIFESFEFIKFKLTKEDLFKTQQYKSRLKFVSEKNQTSNELDFLKKIKLNAKIVKIDKNNEQRCLQIINKTNQFNLTTKRYSSSEIQNFKNTKNNLIFMVSLSDKYGDHGIVALVMLRLEKYYVYIDNFAISCRVLGRQLELWILSRIVKLTKKRAKFIIGEYIFTKKNSLVANLYKDLGFKPIKKNFKNIPTKLKNNFDKNSIVSIVDINQINFSKVNKIYSE